MDEQDALAKAQGAAASVDLRIEVSYLGRDRLRIEARGRFG